LKTRNSVAAPQVRTPDLHPEIAKHHAVAAHLE